MRRMGLRPRHAPGGASAAAHSVALITPGLGLAVPLALLALFALLPLPARADLGGFVLADFETDLTVQADADLLVEERITVDFLEPRHGIYRAIPIRYTDPRGYLYSLNIRVLEVTDGEGRRVPLAVSHQGRYINIRIGDANRTVHGTVHYTLRYRARNALGHFAEHDEIYWNATGNEWNAPIRRASATVRLPARLPADSLQVDAFIGRFAQREPGTSAVLEPGVVRFTSPRALQELEGLTVAVAWPRGHVAAPSSGRRALRFLGDNWVLLAPLAVLIGLWTIYRRRGRDPRGPEAVVVRYEPPPGVTPGEIGTLVDERVDLRDVTATLVDLAVRGYLVIRIERREMLFGLGHRSETIFESTGKDRSDLLAHESALLTGLFASGDVVEASALRQKFYLHLPGIRSALYARLVTQGHFRSHPETVRRTTVVSGIAAWLLVFIAGMLWAKARGGIFPHALIVPLIAGTLSAIPFFVFAPAMPRRTASGVRLRAWALGFEEFVERVEGEQLERDRARNVFEGLLPYAMALGIASRWARRFEGVYDRPPAWFQGPSPGAVFSATAFHQSLSSAMQQTGTTMTAAPRSSGSSGVGGGGFSGGGGGGGGGGSW